MHYNKQEQTLLRTALPAVALLLLAQCSVAEAGVPAWGMEECSAEGLQSACGEEQVEQAEERIALGMRTELLQADAVRFRAPSSALPARKASGDGPILVPRKHVVRENHTVLANTSVQVSAPLDPEVANLSHQELNLTKYVHSQAVAVSNETDVLSGSLANERAAAAEGVRLERQYTDVHSKAQTAKKKYEDYLAAVATAKKRRDQLQNETFMVQQQMEHLSGLYREAAKEYESLLTLMPSMDSINSSAAADERQVVEQLRTAGAMDSNAKAVVSRDSFELQKAIEELNRLNSELKEIEGKLESKYKHLNSATAPSAQLGTLILVSVLVAVQQAAALPGSVGLTC